MSDLLGWVYRRADTEPERTRKPWERAEGYPECAAELDGSPAGCQSPHGSPGRYNAGCRGAGCRDARRDYDAYRWRIRTEDTG